MSATKKVVVAEDHKLFREMLVSLLSSRDNLEVVAEAFDGLDAIHSIRQHNPDLLILDLSMPRLNGISVIKDVHVQFPDLKILVLTMHEGDEYILETFRAGINGYCIKDSSRNELLIAIESVLEGKTYISPGVADEVLQGYITGRKAMKEKSSWEGITLREREVLKLLAEGYMNKDIADLLHISVKTVEKHRANIMNKLDLHNAASLTAYAIGKGLVAQKI